MSALRAGTVVDEDEIGNKVREERYATWNGLSLVSNRV